MNRTATLFIVLLSALVAEAQLVEYPLPSASRTRSKPPAGRTQVVDPTFLPFFDDFSANDTLLRDSLWLYGQSVLLNNGMGIRPPSKNVVTFDGVDSLGQPYAKNNDVLAKGIADRLTSQPIRMDLVNQADRNTVYFSFFYQLRGRGEPPDPGDQLILSFKAQDGTWENVVVLETSSTMPTDVFQQVIIPVSDDRFFHDAFQFRFSNYARLSGPFDTWNVDYVYLNRFRDASDIYYPDRTISSQFTSLFVDYYSMPIEHFLKNRAGNLDYPSLELYNLKAVDSVTGEAHKQPLKFNTLATIDTRINGTITSVRMTLDTLSDPGVLPGLQFRTLTLNTLPDSSQFSLDADSIHIRIELAVNTKDNVLSSDDGDYNPQKYRPIDFRYSDTLSVAYVLSSYYAYDDGTAEYGAGLNQAGTYFAYQFNSRIDSVDTVTYVDIYFPEFGDNTNQSLVLQVRKSLGDISVPPLLEQLIVVERTTKNRFVRYPLIKPVLVSGSFYVGWKQISNNSIPVGLDKNTDNGSRIYYNTNGNWVQNTLVKGSMMVRPGFGKGDGSVITGLEVPVPTPAIYPNPSQGIFTLDVAVDALEIYGLTGQHADHQWAVADKSTSIVFAPGTAGLFLIRFLSGGRRYTQKVMVLPAGR